MAAFVADGGYMPTDDAVSLEAGGAYLIDVLANDIGAPENAGDRMLILVNPACGLAAREEGMISYAVDPACSGVQTLTYCVPSGDVCPSATLTVTVIPAPGAAPEAGQTGSAVSAADPTLTAGGAAREFGGDAATPRFSFDDDDGGFAGALPNPMAGGLAAVGPVDASQPAAGAPSSDGVGAPGQAAAGPFDFQEEEADAALPGFGAIAAVTGPSQRKKRKPRSVYASPAIDALSAERPQRPSGAVNAAPAPEAARRAEDLATAPPERIRLAQAEAARRGVPVQPEPESAAPAPLVIRAHPVAGALAELPWAPLADQTGGTPEAPFLSLQAEFRELVSLAAAPEPEPAPPEPGGWTRVAALAGLEGLFTRDLALEDGPAAAPGASAEPLAELAGALGPLSPPDGFYRMVSLDPHARHTRGAPAQMPPGAAPGARPAEQLREQSEPATEALRQVPSETAALSPAPEGDSSPRTTPLVGPRAEIAGAHPPLPFPERDETPAPQFAERSEPQPPHLAGIGAQPDRIGAPAPRGDRPEGVAFRAGAVAPAPAVQISLQADLSAPALPAQERTEPLPPFLDGWAAVAADMPVMRVSVNLTISGARDMPVRVRRNYQTLSVTAAQSPRLVMLDQAPRDVNTADRTEPLPLNLRRVRSFPPLLSQRVRMTPDFYGVGLPRLGFRVRRYEELAALGANARPFAAFEPEGQPRSRASDPNPPTREEAIAASIAAGLGPFIGPAPQAPRRPFEAAPAPAAGAWPETGAGAPLVLTAAAGAAAEAPALSVPEQAAASMTLAALSPQEPAAEIRPAANTAADLGPAPDCPIAINAFPASGGMIQFQALSECRAGRVALLHLDELRIALRFDQDGEIEAMIPGVRRDSTLKLVAADGAAAQQPITILDIAGVQRVAVVWDDAIDLNLHAFEFGGGVNDDGHVWIGADQDPRGYRRGRNGLVSSFPALDGVGRSVEFYSFNPGRRSPTGRITLAVEFASRGATPQAPYCDGDLLASPGFRIHRFENGVMDGGVARIFEAAPCGAPLEDASIYLRDLVPDFLVLNR